MPLFSNEERHQVGLCYKRNGQHKAILLGLELIGPRMAKLADQGLRLARNNQLSVYCQRGGMRSNSVAWLWRQLGLTVTVSDGGYKRYRQGVLEMFQTPLKLQLLSGSTGVGKTEILQQLAQTGEQVINLEQLAHHKGSAFGWIGEDEQPSSSQFENQLAEMISQLDPAQRIWVEAESRMIGRAVIPIEFWKQMERSPRIYLHRSPEERIQRLCQDYQSASAEDLKTALGRIQKRLGRQRYQQALEALEMNDRHLIVQSVLKYYDRQYEYSRQQHQQLFCGEIDCSSTSTFSICSILKQLPYAMPDNPSRSQQTGAETDGGFPSTARRPQ